MEGVPTGSKAAAAVGGGAGAAAGGAAAGAAAASPQSEGSMSSRVWLSSASPTVESDAAVDIDSPSESTL